ncbi:zinc ribbon domain-containing protein [Mycolicibacterium sediminis]|uniref:Zinc ribbon domain-containing protein n=1 Tax=Mycolicibacterium sediminis TaxID=1286180 RepID=A0A7I7QXU3_9MYCO|nr:zinc ribbon domain-containing protein [Mycolicibacterium sediminis]BBY30736.1 hypothetical protein MSEDJ_48320 [Mycolicibacterium sediminis]
MSAPKCRACGIGPTDGDFCGQCGALTTSRRGDGPDWLRRSRYGGAAHGSAVGPGLVTTVYPLLPRRLLGVFRIALIVVVAVLVVTAAFRWQPPLVAAVGLGLLLLFVAYACTIGVVGRVVGLGVLSVTVGTSAGLGVAWALGTEAAAALESGDALGLPVSLTRVLVTDLAVPLSFVLCLFTTVLVVRLWRRNDRDVLTGYVIGALAAYCFTGVGTLVRLAASFASEADEDNTRSFVGLAAAAIVQGVALPLTAAAVAGAFGAGLWFSARPDDPRPPPRRATSPLGVVAFGVVAYLGLGLLDLVEVPYAVDVAVYALLAVLAVAALRIVLHTTLLHESRDDAPTDETCPQCGADESGPRFCVKCGAARALPTGSRVRPALLTTAMGAGTAVLLAGSVALSAWLTPPEPNYVCPPECGRPPISEPVATNPRFTPDTGEFTVSYPGEGTAYQATFEPNGVVLELLAGEGGVLRLFGEPAEGRSAREIAKQVVEDHYDDATFAYEIPNAMVGYEPGYGEVVDVFPSDSVDDDARARVLVMVAVKNDYALIAAGAGPFREFTPEFGSGHPSGANFFLALDMGKYVNSFTWRGDPPR